MIVEDPFIKQIKEHWQIITKICFVYRDTAEDRKDLEQDILYQAWRSYPDFKRRSTFATWLYRIAFTTAIATYRSKRDKWHREHSRLEQIHDPPTEAEGQSEQLLLLKQAVAQLDDAEKAAITLYLEGYQYAEMADILGISTNLAGVRINRIKNKLKQKLSPHDS